MHILAVLTVFLLAIIPAVFFLSRRLSPIPYFPSNKKDLPLIIKALKLRDNQTIVDLGAGTGDVIFAAAQFANQKRLNTQFVAIEINPILVLIMYIKRAYHPNRDKITIVQKDFFREDANSFATGGVPRSEHSFGVKKLASSKNQITVFLYISPWFLQKVYHKLQHDLKSFTLISYYYPLPKIRFSIRLKGIHDLYRYELKESTINNQDAITKKQTNSKS